jgi:ABC-type transport system substrate-binding protein
LSRAFRTSTAGLPGNPDAAARVLALESGDIDYLAYQALPSSSVPRLKTNAKLVTSLDGFEALASIEILAFNFDNPQLKDVRVRQAIAYAIDKQAIAEKADYGIGKAATGPISSLTAGPTSPTSTSIRTIRNALRSCSTMPASPSSPTAPA